MPKLSASLPGLSFWLVVLLLAVVISIAPIPLKGAPPATRLFQVQASRFSYTPAVITVNPGDLVTIELASQDVVHGLSIDDYALQVSADPGQPARLTFTADKTGSFRLRCSVTCGSMHPFMIGKLQVGQNNLFWRGLGLAALAVVASVWRGKR